MGKLLTSGERLRRKGQTKAPKHIGKRDLVENLIVVGASAGGHSALIEILRELPIDIPAAIVILLHLQLGSHYSLKDMLARFTRLPVVLVEDSEPLRHKTIFVPPAGKSACFDHGMIRVDDESVPNQKYTTIDRMFASAAKAYGRRVIGVVLSGNLKDGTNGLQAVYEAGGLTIVQDPAEAEYSSMPANAMANLPVTFCVNLLDIAAALELLVRRETEFETGLAFAVRILRTRVSLLVRLVEQSWRNPGAREFLMKELALLNRDLSSINDLVKGNLTKVSRFGGR